MRAAVFLAKPGGVTPPLIPLRVKQKPGGFTPPGPPVEYFHERKA